MFYFHRQIGISNSCINVDTTDTKYCTNYITPKLAVPVFLHFFISPLRILRYQYVDKYWKNLNLRRIQNEQVSGELKLPLSRFVKSLLSSVTLVTIVVKSSITTICADGRRRNLNIVRTFVTRECLIFLLEWINKNK